MGTEGRVALQTTQAVVKSANGNFRSGSVGGATSKKAGMDRGLHIWRANERERFNGSIRVASVSLPRGDGVKIEAYGVPTIAQIRNEHIEIKKGKYPHLQGLRFSDVNRNEEILGIDLLIGADGGCFQRGRIIRGEVDQPVAVETCFG